MKDIAKGSCIKSVALIGRNAARLGWTEPMLKKFFGWKKDSRMPATYIHLAETDIEDTYYEMYGKAGVKRECKQRPAQKALVCPACSQKNPTGFLFCFNCNRPLDEASRKKARANSILDLIVTDEVLRQRFDGLLEMAYKKSCQS